MTLKIEPYSGSSTLKSNHQKSNFSGVYVVSMFHLSVKKKKVNHTPLSTQRNPPFSEKHPKILTKSPKIKKTVASNKLNHNKQKTLAVFETLHRLYQQKCLLSKCTSKRKWP